VLVKSGWGRKCAASAGQEMWRRVESGEGRLGIQTRGEKSLRSWRYRKKKIKPKRKIVVCSVNVEEERCRSGTR